MGNFFRAGHPVRLIVVGVVLVIALGAVVLLFATQSRAEEQPIEFPHRVMVQVGITCLFCHTDAMDSPAAGMPSQQKCMGCHEVIATDAPAIQELSGYWERGEPVRWVRVIRLPRFVWFSHRMHVAAGLNCERCHGDVAQMEEYVQSVDMNMGWCLDCHQAQPEETALSDCIVCHD